MTSNNGQWTRDDLPNKQQMIDLWWAKHGRGSMDAILDAVVEHLNAHHPKPQPYDQGGMRGADSLLRRAERERDDARAERDDANWKLYGLRESYRNLSDRANALSDRLSVALRERDAAVARAEQAERERDEWKARAEDAIERARIADAECEEAKRAYCDFYDYATLSRPAPAVSREQRETVADHLWDEMVGSAKSVVRDAVARAFTAAGIETAFEAEATPDPVEAKVSTRRPQDYVLVDEGTGSRWRMTADGKWSAEGGDRDE